MFKPKQLTLNDIYAGCIDSFDNDKPGFLSLLSEHIDLDALIHKGFVDRFYKWTGRPRKYPLTGFIMMLIIQRLFSIPTDRLLLIVLHYSKELREFCGFDKLPDASMITRFKQKFADDLGIMFDRLVDLTEPICQDIDEGLARVTIFDTSGIEAYVRENNPKFIDTLIRGLKAWKKAQGIDEGFDPYKAAYSRMPSHAAAEPAIKQMHINGHFCYAYKFGIVTNGLGIVRDITLYDEEFIAAHPEIEIEKKEDSPDEDKTLGDAKSLIPTLEGFFERHPSIKPSVFIGDSSFDSAEIYAKLLGKDGFGFDKAFIPLNSRGLKYPDCPLNENGVPCCPNDTSLPMKPESGKSNFKCGRPTFKFVCPKMKWVTVDGKSCRRTSCENPCTDSPCGRMFYVYPEKDLRTFPGTIRGTDEWDETYKVRGTVEKSINHFKGSFCLAGRKSRNALTSKADLYLAGITQLVSVLLADSIHKRDYIRSLKPLIAA